MIEHNYRIQRVIRSKALTLHTFLAVCGTVLAGCVPVAPVGPQTNSNPSDSGGGGVPQRMEVTRFFVAATESIALTSNTEVVATEGIEIAGELVVNPADGGDLALTALNGDLVISGRIIVDGPSEGDAPDGRLTAARGPQQNVPLQQGASIRLTARTGDLIMRKTTLLQSGRGYDAPAETFSGPGPLHVGQDGTNGGDIVLSAPNGMIRLPMDRGRGDLELFGLGSGGHGASVTVSPSFDTDQTAIEVRGGHGGDSGRVVFDALGVIGVPDVTEFDLLRPDFKPPLVERRIDRANGGHGGNVSWSTTDSGTEYPLTDIQLQGGGGGAGILDGGPGGMADYRAQRVINGPGVPTAVVSCYGGQGGDVLSAPVPIVSVSAGTGGMAFVLGNPGRDGEVLEDGTIYTDGARGGDVLAQGGEGGDVLADVVAFTASAGDGGDAEALANVGGAGLSRCDGCAGGNAGDTGDARAFGGSGGNVLLTSSPLIIESEGGAGGNTWAPPYEGPHSPGGNGNPPGSGGCSGSALAEPGRGGMGSTAGRDGFDETEDVVVECGSAGVDCGIDEACTDESGNDDDPQNEFCAPGTTFTVTHEMTQENSANYLKVVATGEWLPFSNGWKVVQGSVTDVQMVGTEIIEVNQDHLIDYFARRAFGGATTATCWSGELQWPGDTITISSGPITDTITHTYQITGCFTSYYTFRRREDYDCCYSEILGGDFVLCEASSGG